MFDKMVKMKNRKGFTLVEMLIVIAIIAILVSIIVPVVGVSRQKAAAATNAANLRSIEGELSALRAQNPLAFSTALETLGAELKVVLQDRFASSGIDIIDSIANKVIDDSVNEAMDFLDTIGLNAYIESGNALSELVKYHVYHSTADTSGTLQISTVTLNNVPAAKGVSVPGMEVEEGTPMTVYITESTISATYESGVYAYNRDDFAEVAETGEFNGTASGGLSSEAATNSAYCYMNGHTMRDCVCSVCGHEEHVATGDTHKCDCGQTTVNAQHKDETGGSFGTRDGKCDYTDCSDDCGTEGSGIAHVFSLGSTTCSGCKKSCGHDNRMASAPLRCSDCGSVVANSANYQMSVKHGLSGCYDDNNDGKCDACGATKSACTCEVGKGTYSAQTCSVESCKHKHKAGVECTDYNWSWIAPTT